MYHCTWHLAKEGLLELANFPQYILLKNPEMDSSRDFYMSEKESGDKLCQILTIYRNKDCYDLTKI